MELFVVKEVATDKVVGRFQNKMEAKNCRDNYIAMSKKQYKVSKGKDHIKFGGR